MTTSVHIVSSLVTKDMVLYNVSLDLLPTASISIHLQISYKLNIKNV